MSKSIEELDSNFQRTAADENGITWYDAHTLTLEGLGWPSESQAYCRLPNRAENVVSASVWILSQHSAGACVRFVSDAPTITARWTLRSDNLGMPHMPATGVSGLDVYVRDDDARWRWGGIGIPQAVENEAALISNTASQTREYMVYLPLYNGTATLDIGVPTGAVLTPAPPHRQCKTIGFYGTSIVHGGCASRAGMAYPAIIGRALDCATINLGFSGNGRGEAAVAKLLAELDVDIWVLDPLPNMDDVLIRERMGHFVKTLRAAHPHIPIVLVESVEYQNGWLNADRESRSDSSNRALQDVYNGLLAENIKGLHYIAGAPLLGDDGEGTVDGTHPNDIGFARIAHELLKMLHPLMS